MDAPGRPSGRTLSINAHGPDAQSSYRASKPCVEASAKEALASDGRFWSPVCAVAPQSKASSPAAHSPLRNAPAADPFTEWLLTFAPSGGRDSWHAFKLASMVPPISEESLKELDIMRIVANVRLRHDINFDRELHFKPNFEGDKGKEKQLQASQYWQALEVELELCNFLLAAPAPFNRDARIQERLHESMQRLPAMFKTLKDVLVSLMPANDRNRVDEMLDVSFIMQSVARGVFDLPSLAHWLAMLLKAHCAPMRDSWVDRMEALMCGEFNQGISSASHIVTAMKELFGILEAMKLDVANHQIRYLRSHLVANTFAFERHYHTRRIAEGRFDASAARQWYNTALGPTEQRFTRFDGKSKMQVERFAAFTGAWLACIVPHAGDEWKAELPATFKLDLDRLQGIQTDLKNLVFKHICCIALRTVAGTIDASFRLPDGADDVVMERISQLVGRAPTPARWQAKCGNISVELIRICGEYMPRKRQTIDAMLGSLCGALEPYLQTNLRDDSGAFRQAATELTHIITQHTAEAGHKILESTSSEIFDALAPPLPSSVSDQVREYYAQSGPSLFSASAASCGGGVLDIVRRVAQISMLHWRVWSPLVYRCEDEGEGEAVDEAYASQAPSRPSSAGSEGSAGSISGKLDGFSFGTSSPGPGSDDGYCSAPDSDSSSQPGANSRAP